MSDERLARWRDTWHKIAASEFAGETVYSHEAFGVVLAALDAATARRSADEARLDHYRGTCQRCGRDGVLLDYIAEYDGMETICLEDREECERLHEEQERRDNEAFRARVAAGDPLAVMADQLGRTMLEMSRQSFKPVLDDFKPGRIVQFVTSNFAPTTEEEG